MQWKQSVRRTKKHEVWELCFAWEHCSSDNLYSREWFTFLPARSGGHSSPCKGKWNLCVMPEQYQHSSAKFYLTGAHGFFMVDNVAEMEDKVFVQVKNTIINEATFSGNVRDIAERNIF